MTSARSIRRRGRGFYLRGRRAGRRLVRSSKARRSAAAFVILVAAFAFGAWAVLPYAIASAMERWAERAADRHATADRVRVNPFTLTVTLDDVAIGAESGSIFAERVVVDLDASALLGRRTALDGLSLHRPQVSIAGLASLPSALETALSDAPRYRIDRLEITDGQIEWRPENGAVPGRLSAVTLAAAGFDGGAETPAAFELAIDDAAGGSLRADGELRLPRREASVLVTARDIDAGRVLEWTLGRAPAAGTLGGTARIEWRGAETSIAFREFGLDGAVVGSAAGAEHGAGRLAAQRIRAAGLRVDLSRGADGGSSGSAPAWSGRAWADEIVVSEPRSVVVLAGRALRSVVGDASSPAPDAARAGAPGTADAGRAAFRPLAAAASLLTAPRPSDGRADTGFAAAVERIELRGGMLRVVDERLSPATAFELTGVDGVLSRAGSDAAVTAEVAADVAGGGSASLALRAHGAGLRDFDLELADVPAEMLAAYAERLAGRAIGGGVVGANVEYRLSDGRLEGVASVRSRGLELRPADGGPPGGDPVRLGLALLEDADGEAAASVPLSAHAETHLPEVLAAALIARLDAAAERPFDALADAVGADGAALDAVPFPAGAAAPTGQASETIATLADAMLARPSIGLRVQGTAERGADRDELAAEQIELHVTLATAGPDVVARARPRPVDFDSPRHRDVLDEFAGERLGAELRETIASYFTRDADGRVVETERSDYYRTLFDALVEHETIPDQALERLARYRAISIADGLESLGVAAARIDIAAPLVVDARGPAGSESVGAARADAGSADGGGSGAPERDAATSAAQRADPADGAPVVEAPLGVFLPLDAGAVD